MQMHMQSNKTRRNYSVRSTFGGTSGKSAAKSFRNRTWSNITRNSTTPLSNFDIIDKLKAVPGFHGVYSKDELAAIKSPSAVSSCVINIQDFNDGSGTHWEAVYNNNYFDSFGLPPSDVIKKYMNKKFKKVYYSSNQLQPVGTSACGYYCIMFIRQMSRNLNFLKFILQFDKQPSHANDEIAINFI